MLNRGKLTRYSASAGSGKTYVLAGIYLELLFLAPHNYRNILAVTFTNKAAAEMKERILITLFKLANGSDTDYLDKLIETSGKNADWVQARALEILNNILHDYSRFSVGTIDSFFQKVLRAFVKESGLHAGFNLILDHSVILAEAVDEMLMSVDDDDSLKQWLIEYSQHEISEGKHWDLKGRIIELGKELFKEEFRLLDNDNKIVSDKEILKDGLVKLIRLEKSFAASLSELATSSLSILEKSGVTSDELRGKGNSIMKFLLSARESVPAKLSASIIKAWKEELYYSGKTPPYSVSSALENGLHGSVSKLCEFYEGGIKSYLSARLVRGNLFNLGILTDISTKIRHLLNESNKFLLSDAGDLLGQIIERDQTPFIYEKVGTRYRNFMIDEFQDTSLIQWRNFSSLIENSLAEGDSNLVVGDIKQAIYRWRNSDWRILDKLESKFDPELFVSDTLLSNWRSSPNIIAFNNLLFKRIPGLLEEKLELEENKIERLYREAEQKDPGRKKDGYVRLKQVVSDGSQHQKTMVLDELPSLIEEIQDNGYSAGDIGILVRKNSEGQEVINHLMEYSATVDDKKNAKYSYQVISQDSLFLVNSPVIQFLIATLEYIVDRNNILAFKSMVHYISIIREEHDEDSRPDLLDDEILDSGFEKYIASIRYMPVFDMLDRLIAYFDLGSFEAGIPFLNTLQDLVLDLSSTETNDIPFFLEWWHNEGFRKSVASPEQDDSIQLMTIHKSKGLQFKVVIVPFLSWSMGHGMAPILWVYSDKTPFNNLGAVPVRYKKEIAETHFKKYYDKEKLNVAIDKLNLLYVALTRSEECLYAFVPFGQRRDPSIGSLVVDAVFEGEDEYILGSVPKQEIKEKIASGGQGVIIPYGVTVADERLRLRMNSKDYIIKDEKGETRVSYGLLMHDILSRIDKPDDIDSSLLVSFKRGEITSAQKADLSIKLKDRFKNPEVQLWFNPKFKTWREQDILLPGGDLRRPDRVVIMDDHALVIDFKFGLEHTGYIKQLNEYIGLVKDILNMEVKGAIWYVDTNKIVSVGTQ